MSWADPTPTASLPMYDLPEVTWALDAWWSGLARAMTDQGITGVPQSLTRGVEFDVLWRDPDLLFSQTCGYPLTHGLRGVVRVVATPMYAAFGCSGPQYSSVLAVRGDDRRATIEDFRGTVVAFNNLDSQSGYSALRAAVAPYSTGGRFFARAVASGGHANSLAFVANGRADICAVDCVTFGLLERHRPTSVQGLRVLGETVSAPGLPYVTRGDADDDLIRRLRTAVSVAHSDPALAEARAALLIAGVEVLPDDSYGRILEIERTAERLGYPQIA